jgi:aminoglycoside/choline kinase family phosphotransferase
MQEMIDAITEVYRSWSGNAPASVDVLPQSGSDRRYFRLHAHDKKTVIATCGAHIRENATFVYFAEQLGKKNLPVPRILAVSEDHTIYLQEDLGDTSLLNLLEANGYTNECYALFKKSLKQLARLQVLGDQVIDYERCLTNEEFGKQAIMADLLYFKYYFLDALQKPYDKQKLIDDFEALSSYLTHTEHKYFMFRDFQSRNIQVLDGEVYFIDFQGGMKGAPQYDVASLIWQAKANLPDNWKMSLVDDYMDAFEEITGHEIDRAIFKSQYNGFVLIRLLQVLGAYGFRGMFERKAHFLTSIPQALKNLRSFIDDQSIGISLPQFRKVLEICVDDEIIQKFTPIQADEATPLVVKICSFSYKKGIPLDSAGNGGGFVFDCRGIDNPGRHDQYKTIHGRDKPVMEYLERQTRMQDFLNSVFDIVDISVEEYIRRGFISLAVNFGCTGGQHRSVYAADALARHLKNKYKVKIDLCHTIQEEKKWNNTLPAADQILSSDEGRN